STHSPSTAIYTLSLHDALPICAGLIFGLLEMNSSISSNLRNLFSCCSGPSASLSMGFAVVSFSHSEKEWFSFLWNISGFPSSSRSEEHTSELQSRENLVCRLLL